MGEGYIDLFSAGAYALVGRVHMALAGQAFNWLFFVLAAAGILFAIWQSVAEDRPDFWIRHLAAVTASSVLILHPQTVDLTTLTYASPGTIETLLQTQHGAAPSLTYWVERLGSSATLSLRSLTHQTPVIAIPGIAAKVADLADNPGLLNDPQLRANLQIWRQHVVPQLLTDDPDLAKTIRDQHLDTALTYPGTANASVNGTTPAAHFAQVETALRTSRVDLGTLLAAQSPLNDQIADDAGATPWRSAAAPNGSSTVTHIVFSSRAMPLITVPGGVRSDPAYVNAEQRGRSLVLLYQGQFPEANQEQSVQTVAQLYDLLGRSVYFQAGISLASNPDHLSLVGSYCQRTSDATCRAAFSGLPATSGKLFVPPSDPYTTGGWTTWVEQPITTVLLGVTAIILNSLSSLVIAILPFALGVAKCLAILVSVIGVWMLLWPGRVRVALSWMMAPIAFVSLWSVLFNLWADLEPALSGIASAIGDADNSTWSAGRAMSIAIALGYLGLPTLALNLVYGESGKALYHASSRLENALTTAWHTRSAVSAFSRRWIVNSPMVKRWNQRVYRAVGMGPLRSGINRRSPDKRRS